MSWQWAEDGSLVLRGRFAPAEGAALIAAIEALIPREPVGHPVPPAPPDRQQAAPGQPPGAVADRVGARRADALLELVAGHDRATDGPTDRGGTRVVVRVDVPEGPAEIQGGPQVPAAVVERLGCDAEVQVLLQDERTNRLYLGRSRRLGSPAQIAALTVRDGGRCRFPGCPHNRYLHAHHVVHWLHGGRTDLDNPLLICSFHHAPVHDHGYRIRSTGDGRAFDRPDGTPVPAGPVPLPGNVESLIEINTRAELAITRDNLTPTRAGGRLDLQPVLDRLLPRPLRTAA